MPARALTLDPGAWESGSSSCSSRKGSEASLPRRIAFARARLDSCSSSNGPVALPPSPRPIYIRAGAPPPPPATSVAGIVGSVDVLLQLLAASSDCIDEEPITGGPSEEDAEGVFGSKLHMLVVDDIKVFRSLCGRFLHRLGCTFVVLEDGNEVEAAVADAVAAGKPYDGIMLDIFMPRMGGAEVCAALRAKAFHLPIIAMTSAASDEEKENYYDIGFDVVLPKPFTQDSVCSALKEALSRQRNGAARARARSAVALPLPLDLL